VVTNTFAITATKVDYLTW